MNKIIISDTSCLIALEDIKLLDILRRLYGDIIITREVKEEFGLPLPEWINIHESKNKKQQADLEFKLDRGEASSIALCLEMPNAQLIIDDLKGRKIALSYNLEIIGTLGVIIMAHKKGLIKNINKVLNELIDSGFRVSKEILDEIINQYGNK